jgi:membrane protease YdiL (CAAX protease family)
MSLRPQARAGGSLVVALAGSTLLSIVLVVVLSPPRPVFRTPVSLAVALGLIAGMLLFVSVTRRTPGVRVPGRLPVTVIGCLVLCLAAANEEVLWRRVVLGELLRAGPVPALVGSTLGFALAHRARPGLHLGTGAVFGGIYLATGVLAASISAHGVYNFLLLFLSRERPAAGGTRR